MMKQFRLQSFTGIDVVHDSGTGSAQQPHCFTVIPPQ